MTKEKLCASPKECKSKSFKLVGTKRVYLCLAKGWCGNQRKEGKGQQSFNQKEKHMIKWARDGWR